MKVREKVKPAKGVDSEGDAVLHRTGRAGSVPSDVRVGVGMT